MLSKAHWTTENKPFEADSTSKEGDTRWVLGSCFRIGSMQTDLQLT